MPQSETGAKPDRFQRVRQRLVATALPLQQRTSEIARVGRLRVRLHGGLDLLLRFVELIHRSQRDCVVGAHLAIVRLQLDGSGEVKRGLAEIAARGENMPEIP